MKYKLEQYHGFQRFNDQYEEIYQFLLRTADKGYNEHFHWGRFEWMMCHTMLEMQQLDKIALLRDADISLVGLITYDTILEDRVYLIHSVDDRELLEVMIDFAEQHYCIDGTVRIKANEKDMVLKEVLQERNFTRMGRDNTVSEISMDRDFSYRIPEGIHISQDDFVIDLWKYQNVLHKGFENEGTPTPWEKEIFERPLYVNNALKVFAFNDSEYCSHCGVWYTQGDTAYIEPVATIPQFRNRGLAKAVVYEAISRARKLGAKRAVVLSDQEFYHRIGLTMSSEIYTWEKGC